MNKYTAIIKKNSDWWIGWVEEIPGINCQEKTKEELLSTIKITLQEAIEINKEAALNAAEENYAEEIIFA